MRRVRGIAILDSTLAFPPVEEARPDGLLAVGGDLSPERLVLAYRRGIFPWSADPISWWSPDPRSIIPLDGLAVSSRLARRIRQGRFTVTFNKDFEGVIRGCAAPAPGREDTWIEPPLIDAYITLHRMGIAHSCECLLDGRLVGGVYGVAIGGLFAGESMFHTAPDASKVALASLFSKLNEQGFTLFDTQAATAFTRNMGAIDIPRNDYLRLLRQAIDLPVSFGG